MIEIHPCWKTRDITMYDYSLGTLLQCDLSEMTISCSGLCLSKI